MPGDPVVVAVWYSQTYPPPMFACCTATAEGQAAAECVSHGPHVALFLSCCAGLELMLDTRWGWDMWPLLLLLLYAVVVAAGQCWHLLAADATLGGRLSGEAGDCTYAAPTPRHHAPATTSVTHPQQTVRTWSWVVPWQRWSDTEGCARTPVLCGHLSCVGRF
jgi:hypothetical protein